MPVAISAWDDASSVISGISGGRVIISGGNGAFVQGLVVNYVQQQANPMGSLGDFETTIIPERNVVERPPKVADQPIRTMEELLTNGKVPSVRGGEFNRWYDNLSAGELDLLWQNKSVRDAIEARIRQPGGLHEWCRVCRAPDFKRWGVSMEEMQRFRTKTSELKWTSPIDGQPGGHGGNSSGTFHNELKAVIDKSNSLDEFNAGVTSLRERWRIDPKLLPSLPKPGGT